MMPRDVMARRDREFAEAKSARDVDMLQQKWLAEDQALAEAQGSTAQALASLRAENRDLRRRLAKLERLVAPKGVLMAGIGDALGRTRKDLERQIEVVDARRLKFCGVYEPGATYEPGSLVTRSGGLWHASKATRETPGASSDWSLCVKSKSLEREPVVA